MLSSSSNAPGRIDVLRTPTEVFLQRDCFCFMQRNINDVVNSTGKIKSTCSLRDVSPGCMKKNTASAETTEVCDIKRDAYPRTAQYETPFTPSGNKKLLCFFTFPDKVAKVPEKVLTEDDEELYVSVMAMPRHEIIDDKDVKSVEDTEEAVEEMEEGSDDGSSFFLASKNRLNREENYGFVKKTYEHGATWRGCQSAGPAKFSDGLATPAAGIFKSEPKHQERLITLPLKALHPGLFVFHTGL